MNKKKIKLLIFIFSALIIIGISYAYYNVLTETLSSSENSVSAGTVKVKFVDGPAIGATNIWPRWTYSKTFTVENTGTLDAYYKIEWSELTNTFINNELVISLNCTGDGCRRINNQPIPSSSASIVEGIRLTPGSIHSYTLTALFIDTGFSQNYNQNQTLDGKINIAGMQSFIEYYDIDGLLVDTNEQPIVNATVTLNNTYVDITDEEGKFKIEGLPLGAYTMKVEDENGNIIATGDIILNSSNSLEIDGNTISADYSKVSTKLTFEVGNNAINSITENFDKLYDMMLKNSVAYSDIKNSEKVQNTIPGIDFTKPNSETNGNGLYYTEDSERADENNDGIVKRIYYYRGNVTNNYVIFGEFCWKILRTTENNAIKLFYWGRPNSDNTCNDSSQSSIGIIEKLNVHNSYGITFSNSNITNSNVGYMHGSSTDTYESSHSNIVNSLAKTYIDDWFNETIHFNALTPYLEDVIYCNDREAFTSEGVSGGGYANETTYYAPYYRVVSLSPTFKCKQINDQFTLKTSAGGTSNYGNNSLDFPVGLMTVDEAIYTGIVKESSSGTFISTYQRFWTMSPKNVASGGYTSIYSIAPDTFSIFYEVNQRSGSQVHPVIALKYDTRILGGDGNASTPYIIKTN